MRLITVAVFAAEYLLGSRAGRERYAQIIEGAARRLNDSRPSAPLAPRAISSAARMAPTAVPDRNRRLPEGVLVEAAVVARLPGLRLLKLDATVTLAPAELGPTPVEPRERSSGQLMRTALPPPVRSRAAFIAGNCD